MTCHEEYDPQSLDDVEIPRRFTSLIEEIAEQVHDSWARQRLDDGWVYGPERNDQLKEHPGLGPYDGLTEVEKEYDRVTARTVIRALIENGMALITEDHVDGLLEEIDRLNGTIADLESQNDSLGHEVNEAESERDDLSTDLDSANAEIEVLRGEIAELKRQAKIDEEEIESLNNYVRDLENQTE